MLSGNSSDHLNFFLRKISAKEPFSFIRPNDGEYMIIKGTTLTNTDNWTFNSGGTLQHDLLIAIQQFSESPNGYIGIPCKGCYNAEMVDWCIKEYHIKHDKLTYGNLVCNKNWKPFTFYFIENKIPIYYIGPGTTPTNLFNIKKRYYTDPYQVNRWDTEKDIFKHRIYTWIASIIDSEQTDNIIFTFSVGPLSKILISELNQMYLSHSFFDIGSAFDIYLKGSSNRGYMRENDTYSNVVCDFELGHI